MYICTYWAVDNQRKMAGPELNNRINTCTGNFINDPLGALNRNPVTFQIRSYLFRWEEENHENPFFRTVVFLQFLL